MTEAETPATFVQFEYNPDVPAPADDSGSVGQVPSPGLGLLAGFEGLWTGNGFNTIWRPFHDVADPTQDRFLELNVTNESLQFDTSSLGSIPNRGLLQPDIVMSGIRYLQAISDANTNEGLHIEPGLWLNVPATTAPNVPPSVARLASIPHGTTIVAQGLGRTTPGGPTINPVDITPFPIGQPNNLIHFREQDLDQKTKFRTPDLPAKHITPEMVKNPNSVLAAAITNQKITSTTTFRITTANMPILGGGTANTAFLEGADGRGNADSAQVTAIFWLETLEGQQKATQLQYTQTVLLNFNGLSWPHVTVATLSLHPAND